MKRVRLIHSLDGEEAAGRLSDLLRTTGVQPVLNAPESDDQAIILLTPQALTDSEIRRELIRSGSIPIQVDEPSRFPTSREFAELIRRLSDAGQSGASYVVFNNQGGAVGERATVVNFSTTGGSLTGREINSLISALQAQPSRGLIQPNEVKLLLDQILLQTQRIEENLDGALTTILARFDEQEQRILAPLMSEVEASERRQLDAILESIEISSVAADELDFHLNSIDAQLQKSQGQLHRLFSSELAEGVRQIEQARVNVDTKHKLELSIPLVPLLVRYKTELSLGTDVVQVWDDLKRRFGRSAA